jgi:hypothetical protein
MKKLMIKFKSDIDIDFGNRELALACINHTRASQLKDGQLVSHNTGVYVTDMPQDPFTGLAGIPYDQAEDRGYVKLDLLNVSLYQRVQSEAHLLALMEQTPDWARFNSDREFFEQLIHVNNHWELLKRMPDPVDSIPRLAMFLAVIRPAKRSLVGQSWKDVAERVWERPVDDTYYFKKSHAVAYAHLVVVNMNLLGSASN